MPEYAAVYTCQTDFLPRKTVYIIIVEKDTLLSEPGYLTVPVLLCIHGCLDSLFVRDRG
jgi:hypothetical protein